MPSVAAVLSFVSVEGTGPMLLNVPNCPALTVKSSEVISSAASTYVFKVGSRLVRASATRCCARSTSSAAILSCLLLSRAIATA